MRKNTVSTFAALVAALTIFFGAGQIAQAQNPFSNVYTDGYTSYKDANDPNRQPFANSCKSENGWFALTVVNGRVDSRKPGIAVANSLYSLSPGTRVVLEVYLQAGDKTSSLSQNPADNRGFTLAFINEVGRTGETLATLINNQGGFSVLPGVAFTSGWYTDRQMVGGAVIDRKVLGWQDPSSLQPKTRSMFIDFIVPEDGEWGLHLQGFNGEWVGSWATLYCRVVSASYELYEPLLRDVQSRVSVKTAKEIRDAFPKGGRPTVQPFQIKDPETGQLIGWNDKAFQGWIVRLTGQFPQTFNQLYGWTVYAQLCAGLSGYDRPWEVQLGNSGCVDTVILRSLVEGANDPGNALVMYTTTLGQLADKLTKARPFVSQTDNEVDSRYIELTARFFIGGR